MHQALMWRRSVILLDPMSTLRAHSGNSRSVRSLWAAGSRTECKLRVHRSRSRGLPDSRWGPLV